MQQPVASREKICYYEVKAEYHFCGYSDADRQKLRGEILRTTREDLLNFSKMLDRLRDVSGVCVIGSKEQLNGCQKKFDCVERLQ